MRNSPNESNWLFRYTELFANLSTTGLLAAAIIGYFYTVRPIQQRDQLQEDIMRLEKQHQDLIKDTIETAWLNTLGQFELAIKDELTETLCRLELPGATSSPSFSAPVLVTLLRQCAFTPIAKDIANTFDVSLPEGLIERGAGKFIQGQLLDIAEHFQMSEYFQMSEAVDIVYPAIPGPITVAPPYFTSPLIPNYDLRTGCIKPSDEPSAWRGRWRRKGSVSASRRASEADV